MKKWIVIIVVGAAAYTGFWWHCANDHRDRLVAHLEKWKAEHATSPFKFEYDAISIGGFPFYCNTLFHHPHVEFEHGSDSFRAELQGDIIVGARAWGDERFVEKKGEIRAFVKAHEQQLAFSGKTDLEIDFRNPIHNAKSFNVWLENLSVSRLYFNLNNGVLSIEANPGRSITSIDALTFDFKHQFDGENGSKISLEAVVEGMELNEPFIALSQLDPLNAEILQHVGKINWSLSLASHLPSREEIDAFIKSPSLATMPRITLDIPQATESSNIDRNKSSFHFSVAKAHDGQEKIHVDLKHNGEIKEGYAQIINPALEKIHNEPGKTMEDSLVNGLLEVILPRVTHRLPLKSALDVDFNGTYVKTDPSTYLSMTDDFKFSWNIDQWGGLDIDGKVKQKGPHFEGSSHIAANHFDGMINSLTSIYNAYFKRVIEIEKKFRKDKEVEPVSFELTKKQIETIRSFIKQFSTNPDKAGERFETTLSIEQDKVMIGNKNQEEAVALWQRFLKDMDEKAK